MLYTKTFSDKRFKYVSKNVDNTRVVHRKLCTTDEMHENNDAHKGAERVVDGKTGL